MTTLTTLRSLAAGLLGRGVVSAWYAVLTGLAMLVVARALASAAHDDRAAGAVAVLFLVTGAWQLQRGLRAELARTRPGAGRRRT